MRAELAGRITLKSICCIDGRVFSLVSTITTLGSTVILMDNIYHFKNLLSIFGNLPLNKLEENRTCSDRIVSRTENREL